MQKKSNDENYIKNIKNAIMDGIFNEIEFVPSNIIQELEQKVLQLSAWFCNAVPQIESNIMEPEINDDEMSDIEADAETLRNVGWGTEEDYGGALDREDGIMSNKKIINFIKSGKWIK